MSNKDPLQRLNEIVQELEKVEAERQRQAATGYKPIVKVRPQDYIDVREAFELLRSDRDNITTHLANLYAASIEGRANTDILYSIEINRKYKNLLLKAAQKIREISGFQKIQPNHP